MPESLVLCFRRRSTVQITLDHQRAFCFMDISIPCVVRRKCFEFLSKKLILIKEFLLETSCRRHCNTCVVKGKTVLGWLNLIHGCKVALGITMVYREQHVLVGHMALLLLCSLDQKTPFCLQPFCMQ